MMSSNRRDYGSASEWLSVLRQDDAWLSQQQRLQASTPASANDHHEDALRRIGRGDTFEFWEIYGHQIEPVVREVWEIAELSLPKLKIQTIGMLSIEWLEQHKESCRQDENGIRLPKCLDTPMARESLALAIERQYMEAVADGKYRWIGTGDRGGVSQLAYFLGKVYKYRNTLYGNAGMNFPEDSLNELFGVKRLYSSLTQVYNAKRPQPWRSKIDAMFE
jgi:hypothetical protein